MTTRLEGSSTFRDLGGVRMRDGTRLRTGRLYRAGIIDVPSSRDQQILNGLGIRSVIDLRSTYERDRHANGWGLSGQANVIAANVESDIRVEARTKAFLGRGGTGANARMLMLDLYADFPRSFSEALPKICRSLATESDLPLLIHCTAGKDRTGFACALVLYALGCDEETIIDDFVRTADFIEYAAFEAKVAELLEGMLGYRPEPEVIRILCEVRGEYLETAFNAVRREYHSIERYLERVGGLSRATIEKMRELYVE